MEKVFEFRLPENATPESIKAELNLLTDGTAEIEVRKVSKSGGAGRLGQIDPFVWEVIVKVLQSATASGVSVVLGKVVGYLFARAGRQPKTDDSKTTQPNQP